MSRTLMLFALMGMAAPAFCDEGKGKTKTFIDVHHAPPNLTDEQLAADHKKDVEAEKHHKGVKFTRFWYEKNTGTLMCECQAQSKEDCEAVHKEAGHPADETHEMVEHH